MFGLRAPELILILVILLLLFGAAKLPEIGRAVGKTLAEFKKGMNEAKKEIEKADAEPEKDDTKK